MAVSSRGLKLAIVLALVWGSSYPLIKIASSYASPVLISMFRVVVSSVFFLALTKGRFVKGKDELIVGIFNVAFFMLLLNFGTALSPNPGIAAIMIYTQPIFVIVIEKILGANLSLRSVMGVLIGFTGIAISVSSSSFSLGTMISLLGGLTWALGTVIFSRKIRNSNVLELNAFISLVSIPILIPFLPIDFYFIISPMSIGILISLAVLAQVAGYVTWFSMVKEMGGIKASSSSLLVPVMSYVMSFILLRDIPTQLEVIGSIVTLVGIYITLSENRLAGKR